MSRQRNYRKIIISRTDSIGDVVLTLPLLGLLKKYYPGTDIVFLGQSYTRAVVKACEHADEFIDWKEISSLPFPEQVKFMHNLQAGLILHVFPVKEIAHLAKRAGIPERIGSTGRLYHYSTCNKLVRLSRKNSPLHEAMLNIRLTSGLLKGSMIPVEDIPGLYGMNRIKSLPEPLESLIDRARFNLILHPKSKGSAREWGSANFAKLSAMLPASEYKVFITGTAAEGAMLKEEGFFDKAGEVTDTTGKMSLDEMISFINTADGLIAASTGPLHLAAALGKVALGIYPPIRPMHPGRWAPLGKRADYLVADKECSQCRKTGPCQCMLSISPLQVKQKLDSLVNP
ncbi:ADP-heptose:LPS heptosyltransferase [Lentimicrobium saccharophilum]|uniref:ADP-heptose:LPS heptosyltransferase n=1 Tax=Lentimicrobium saccharophilum TaxID=1678841 RepID=A0A0S7BZC6_9BACT|nr:glycosyltransferase family 9 protein [Lentimicrobium saccharophilum]GAP43911.1 ADP-heptose:LPS heptosyltransferase [Lentimicrobium saccharophilum]